MRSTCTRTHTHTGISKSITEYVTISRLACIISATRLSIKGSSQASPPASQISLMVSLHRPNNRCCLESCCFQVSNMLCMCRPASATCSREDTPDEAAAHRGLKYTEKRILTKETLTTLELPVHFSSNVSFWSFLTVRLAYWSTLPLSV